MLWRVGFPFDSPFDVTDENILARECVADCRRKSLYTLLCILGCVSILFLLSKIHITGVGLLLGFFAFGLFIASIWLAVSTIISGATYLLKYRHTKQGIFSILCRTTFGGIWLLLIFLAWYLPATGPGLQQAKHMNDVHDAKQLGGRLIQRAWDNNGKFPDDLDAFVKTEFTKKELASSATKKLLYKKGTKQLRWILTPGLTANDDPRIILLRSAEKFNDGKHEGLVIFTVGQNTEYVKDPDKHITIINGKPTFR